MNYNAIWAKFQGTLRISDIRTTAEKIVQFVIKNRLMICDQGRPYVNCNTYWSLCKPDELPSILYTLLLPEQARSYIHS